MQPCPAPFNLSAYVLARAADAPDKIALSILGPARAERWSYGKLERAVRAVGAGLQEAGLREGDRLLLRLGNTVSFPLAYLGAIAVGIVPIPASAQLTTAELDAMIGTVAPTAQVAAPGVALPSAQLLTLTEDTLTRWAKRPAPLADYALGDPERLAYILFTSGTSSGQPRAVAHAHRAIWARQMMFDDWYGLGPDDRLLHAGALNWSFTLGTGLLDPWTVGATALVPAEGTAIEALPLLLARHDATLFAAAPGVLRRLLKDASALSLPKLRHTLTAGEHLHATLRESWEAATGRGLYEAFGMTECSTFLSARPGAPAALRPQTGRQMRVTEDGTIAVHRDEPGLMLGYLDHGKPSLPLTDDWYLTSDRATQNADGTITYLGRSGDLLNAGGYRISPLELEAALCACTGVSEAAVTELASPSGARYLAACYTGTGDPEALALNTQIAARLAPYKHPRRYLRVDTLPRGANGKLLRRALPALFEES
ncbi:MAG: class I adenylate-forming enzyme family protein [Pseudomonadota bacterium]